MNNKYNSSYIFTLIASAVVILAIAFICALGVNGLIDAICN